MRKGACQLRHVQSAVRTEKGGEISTRERHSPVFYMCILTQLPRRLFPLVRFAEAGVNGNFARWRGIMQICKRLLTYKATQNRISLRGALVNDIVTRFLFLREASFYRQRVSTVLRGLLKPESLHISH